MQLVKTFFSFFLDIIETVVVALCIFVIVYLFFLQPHQVVGNSMIPNFHDKEYILTDKISYRFREPRRGEVVVFKSPEDKDKDFIKRVIGLPGEKVKITQGQIYINGAVLKESYLDPDLRTPPGKFLIENEELAIPPDAYVVFGDNRYNSSDSRSWGYMPKVDLIGRALLVYWPPNQARAVPKIMY